MSVADDGETSLVGEVRVGFPVVWLVWNRSPRTRT